MQLLVLVEVLPSIQAWAASARAANTANRSMLLVLVSKEAELTKTRSPFIPTLQMTTLFFPPCYLIKVKYHDKLL